MTDVCPDDVLAHPRTPANAPALDTIDYRIGDFATFRHALLRPLPGELALVDWQPDAEGDLGVQLLEWWAYLADVLAFYNERALVEGLLRTAVAADSVRRIVRLLGYRPRPGIGATGVVAALSDSTRPFVVPRGLPLQGRATIGTSQVFEVDDDVEIGVVGLALPSTAETATATFERVPSLTYAPRRPDGRLLDVLKARDASRDEGERVEAGKEAVIGIEGIVTNVAPNDTVVLMQADWNELKGTALAVVAAVEASIDADGRPITELRLRPGQSLPGGTPPKDMKIMKSTKSAHLWLYHERYPGPKLPTGESFLQGVEQFFDPLGLFSGGISTEPPQDAHVLASEVLLPPSDEGVAHLEGITRGINPGDPVLFEQTAGDEPEIDSSIAELINAYYRAVAPQLADLLQIGPRTLFTTVTGYTELIWYANPPEGDRIGQGPPIGPPSGGAISGGAAPIPIPHSRLSFKDEGRVASGMSGEDTRIKTVVVHYAWEELGTVVERAGTGETKQPVVDEHPGIPAGTRVLIEDRTGAGTVGFVGGASIETQPLVGPLRALINLLPISRGETVRGEVLGRGDPTVARQEWPLARGPLTYLTHTGPGPYDGYRSTLRIRVDGIEWREVASFYGQDGHARVFATREDEEQRTFVRFGDGEHGARLPSGAAVVADYRVGSGADVPPIATLTTILRPQPGLSAIRNPVAPSGGADADPPEQIRRYAPRSALTFGRAVSGDDYETIAAQTPGVRRARAVWSWDADLQRTIVKVLVGDDDAAVVAARSALRAFADPNRPVIVALAAPIDADVRLTIEVDPGHDVATVQSAVRSVLLDPLLPPFGTDVVRIGDAVYDSEIYDRCLDVPGVVAVHGLRFGRVVPRRVGVRPTRVPPGFAQRYGQALPAADAAVRVEAGERHAPGADRYYLLRSENLHIAAEVSRRAR